MLPILYQDEHLVAIDKPSGLLVHRSPVDKNETRFAVQSLRDQIGQRVYPIHRLDKPTSGVLLFALSPDILRQVQAEWTRVEKTYLAVTRGTLQAITLNHPVRTISESGENRVQDAETEFKPLAVSYLPVGFGKQARQYPHTAFSLVEAKPKTGRQHQIRKHLKHLSHPIVGDTRYGKGDINRYFRTHFAVHRLLLHCHQLHFIHPVTDRPLLIVAPTDETWHKLIHDLSFTPRLGRI